MSERDERLPAVQAQEREALERAEEEKRAISDQTLVQRHRQNVLSGHWRRI